MIERKNNYGTVRQSKNFKGKRIRLVPLFMSAVTVVGLSAGIIHYKHATDVTDKNTDDIENQYGYKTINTLYNDDVKEDNFVVLDVGSMDNKTLYMDSKIKYCNDNDISLGLVIDCDTENEYEIYDDIEFVKILISKYKIDFPVYISIDKVMANQNLDVTRKVKLVKSFLDKAIENGICVGIKGTDTNLCNFNKYCFDISLYNIYLKQDSENVKYSGTYTLIENLDGKLKSSVDFSKVIEKDQLNNNEKFVEDAYYIVGDSDTIEEIALKFNLSVKDLLKYNNLKLEDINVGTIIRIPNNSQELEVAFNKNISEFAVKKGVDLSYCQTEIDWSKLSSNVDFVIIKATEGTRVDPLLTSHLENAEENNMPIGIYSITRATTVEEIRKEAQNLVELLKGLDITYPVYIDFETNPGKDYEREIWEQVTHSGKLKEMLEVWSDTVKSAGYIPGLYCNKSTYKSIYDQTNSKENAFLDRFETWIAGTDTYSTECDFNNIIDPGCNTSYQDVNIKCNMRQVSEACVGTGAGTYAGYVDFNYCYTDYEDKDYSYKQSFEIKGLNDKNIKDILMNSALLGSLVIISGGTLFIFVKRKNNKKRNKIR